MLKKPFVIVAFLCAAALSASAEDLFRVIEDAPAWRLLPIRDRDMPSMADSTVDRIIPKGSIVSNVSRVVIYEINGKSAVVHHRVLFEGARYRVAENTFVPIGTDELFHESFLRSTDPQANIWSRPIFLRHCGSATGTCWHRTNKGNHHGPPPR